MSTQLFPNLLVCIFDKIVIVQTTHTRWFVCNFISLVILIICNLKENVLVFKLTY